MVLLSHLRCAPLAIPDGAGGFPWLLPGPLPGKVKRHWLIGITPIKLFGPASGNAVVANRGANSSGYRGQAQRSWPCNPAPKVVERGSSGSRTGPWRGDRKAAYQLPETGQRLKPGQQLGDADLLRTCRSRRRTLYQGGVRLAMVLNEFFSADQREGIERRGHSFAIRKLRWSTRWCRRRSRSRLTGMGVLYGGWRLFLALSSLRIDHLVHWT